MASVLIHSGLQHSKSRHFKYQDWEDGVSRGKYYNFSTPLTVPERETLYNDVLEEVLSGSLPTKCLLVFVSFEPNSRLVCEATREYLINRNCDIGEEFAAVDDLVAVLGDCDTANRGAVLAGLLSLGDRRINAVVRAARQTLTASDVKNFSRVHLPELRSSTVEFCLDWLIELSQNYCKGEVYDIALALMLMVDNDETGEIEDISEIEYVGFKGTKILKTKTFESYCYEIHPILTYLQQRDGFEVIIGKVTEIWDAHRGKARVFRQSKTMAAVI
ncbi:MAG: hypothetical protein ABGY96_09680 [bacterium]|nr:hypothetical protein [Gammaproteobacteria bacterium]HIL97926.1 hypothetical protein [Pseudomonadales bacterium]